MIFLSLLIGLVIQILSHPLLKWPVYQVSLFYTKLTIPKEEWWNRVPGHRIIIGALPLLEEEHHLKLKRLGVTNVVGLLEPFELEDSLFTQPVKRENWTSLGITSDYMETEDFKSLSQQTLDKTYWLLVEILENPDALVYIHCKAGRGRSAAALLTYLSLVRKSVTFEENYAYLKSIRSAINLRDDQKNAVLNFIYDFQVRIKTLRI